MGEMLARVTETVRLAEKAWWDSDDEPEKPLAEVLARAAIAAMREPTKDMEDAAAEFIAEDPNPARIFRTMIDAALK